jgi:hypothetical protein
LLEHPQVVQKRPVLDQHAVPELKQIQNADVDLATACCQVA